MSRLLAAATAILLTAAVYVSIAAASAPLAGLSVQLTDLRVGYGVQTDFTGYRTAQALSDQFGTDVFTLGGLQAHGWRAGYVVRYERACSTCSTGMVLFIDNELVQYATSRGAEWFFETVRHHLLTRGGGRVVHSPGVGDTRISFYAPFGKDGPFREIMFRRGRYVVDLVVSAAAPSSSAGALARTIDQRIRRRG